MKTNVVIGTIALVALLWFLYRTGKRIMRRCRRKECGRIGVKRTYKVLLPPDETISFKSPEGKWRFFIRRPIKLTFTECKCNWVELVKIDTDPISVWHAYWVKWFHKEHYYLEDPTLIEATQRRFRQLYLGSKHTQLDGQASDTPPLSLETLFRDSMELIEKM